MFTMINFMGLGITMVFVSLGVRETLRPGSTFLRKHQCNLGTAVGYFVMMIAKAADEKTVGASIDAGLGALFLWLWWVGGGKDDTKRRIRSFLRNFVPSRRTAAQAA
ncbi:hypothetical protein [Rhodococcus qingshengii]|uniref:hypothetical protein n=1 Tax=Rhodococcus qingshengii TaxID=334542 RepID=UPI0035D7E2D9